MFLFIFQSSSKVQKNILIDCTFVPFPNSDFDSIPAVTPPFYWFPVSSQDLQKPDRIPITSDRMSNVRIKREQNIPLSLKTSNLQLNLCLFKTIKGHEDLCPGFRWENFILKKGWRRKAFSLPMHQCLWQALCIFPPTQLDQHFCTIVATFPLLQYLLPSFCSFLIELDYCFINNHVKLVTFAQDNTYLCNCINLDWVKIS